MKRPVVTKETLKQKVAYGNLIHWLSHLKEDFDRFTMDNGDLMTFEQRLATVDISDFLLRGLEDDAVKDYVFERAQGDDRIERYLNIAVRVLNSETTEDALDTLSDTFAHPRGHSATLA